MANKYLTPTQKKIIEGPFAFISYCWENKEVYDRVQKLAKYLKDNKIPIIYDEGGLEPGSEISQLEFLILDKNCVCVFVVSDDCYLQKVQDGVGGVANEFLLIGKDYLDNPNKYIALKVNETLPIFYQKVYISFSDESHFESIKNFALSKTSNSIIDSCEPQKAKNELQEIEKLVFENQLSYDKEDFSAALKKINKAIILCDSVEIQLKKRLEILNYKLITSIKLKNKKESIETSEKILNILPSNLEFSKKALYYGNCALAYRLNKNLELFEECAKNAWIAARKAKRKDLHYYASLYSVALYDTEQITDAYKMGTTALKLYGYSDASVTFIQYKSNVAEYARKISSKQKSNKNRFLKLEESKNNIEDVINIIENNNFSDTIKYEVYRSASTIFKELSNYYK